MPVEKTWMRAGLTGSAIVVYFALTIVWLPDWVLGRRVVLEASDLIRDVVVTGMWLVAMGLGFWGLRRAQRRGWI